MQVLDNGKHNIRLCDYSKGWMTWRQSIVDGRWIISVCVCSRVVAVDEVDVDKGVRRIKEMVYICPVKISCTDFMQYLI